MAHYAFIDENNIVVDIIVGREEDSNGIDWEAKYAEIRGMTCKRTSYNTYANEHRDGGTPFRGNYAEIGGLYDEVNDVFIPVKPYSNWVLNNNWIWVSPVEYPSDGNKYYWSEELSNWELVE